MEIDTCKVSASGTDQRWRNRSDHRAYRGTERHRSRRRHGDLPGSRGPSFTESLPRNWLRAWLGELVLPPSSASWLSAAQPAEELLQRTARPPDPRVSTIPMGGRRGSLVLVNSVPNDGETFGQGVAHRGRDDQPCHEQQINRAIGQLRRVVLTGMIPVGEGQVPMPA